MVIKKKEDILHPKLAPSGEIIYELIGSDTSIGSSIKQSVAHVTIPIGGSSLAHYHKIMEETYYILSGKAKIVIDNEESILEPHQACLIMPPQIHQIFNVDSEASLEFLCVCGPSFLVEDVFFVN
jgi:mannose-6-phosphate isomerase-like protein (cupin superfamily)